LSGLRVGFPEPLLDIQSKYDRSFSTAKTLHNWKLYNEIDTTTLNYQLKIHTSTLRSLKAAMEEEANETSQQS